MFLWGLQSSIWTFELTKPITKITGKFLHYKNYYLHLTDIRLKLQSNIRVSLVGILDFSFGPMWNKNGFFCFVIKAFFSPIFYISF